MPRLITVELSSLSAYQRGIVLTIRQLDPNLSGAEFKDRLAELLTPELLFGDDVRTFRVIYSELRDFLNRHGATIDIHTSHRIVRQLASGLYNEPEDRATAERLAIEIQRGRSSMPKVALVTDQGTGFIKPTDFHDKVAHNVAMRLKDSESKFSGDTAECWDEYVENYRHIARDYRLTEEQKLLFLHNILCKNARRFLNTMVAPHASTFQQAVDYISAEYNSPVRQARVKNYLNELRLSTFLTNKMKTSEASSRLYKTILKLSTQCPISHRGDAHKTEFLRTAVVAFEWAREPLSRGASHRLTYQQLYGELEAALQLHKEVKLHMLRDRAAMPDASTDEKNAAINYAGQPRLKWGSQSRPQRNRNIQKSPLDVQRCSNCESSTTWQRTFHYR